MLDVLFNAFDIAPLASFLAPVLAFLIILGVISVVRRCFQ